MSMGRESDTPIIVKKQGNAMVTWLRGTKGCVLLRKGLMAHLPDAELE